jgi:thermitase
MLAFVITSLALVALTAAFQNKSTDLQTAENVIHDDLIDLSSTGVVRATEVGKAAPSNKGANQEINIALDLTDPAMSQKYDLTMSSAQMAWAKHKVVGTKLEKACIIDTGIDVNHPDIKNNLWVNPGEACESKTKKGEFVACDKSRNGVDDDGNGFVDDIHGWNFVANNGSLKDNHGHGTHIAGIVGAEGGNNIGISGVAPKISLIIAKYYDPQAPANNNLVNTIRAIRYCTLVGATIINYSGGGLEPSEKEKEAIRDAKDQYGRPILFIAAAGNERSNSDVKKYYPADYDLPNIISVTAVDSNKQVLDSSNYGEMSVDIAAPGKQIYSTLPGGAYGFMTGTSQATAVVTGAAALIRTKFPDYTANDVIRSLTESGDYDPLRLKGKTNSQKRLNIYRALALMGEGTNVSGIIPKNTAQIKASSFTIENVADADPNTRDVSSNNEIEQIAGILKDSKKALDKMNEVNAARLQ